MFDSFTIESSVYADPIVYYTKRPEEYAQIYADENGLKLEEAELELFYKYGNPDSLFSELTANGLKQPEADVFSLSNRQEEIKGK